MPDLWTELYCQTSTKQLINRRTQWDQKYNPVIVWCYQTFEYITPRFIGYLLSQFRVFFYIGVEILAKLHIWHNPKVPIKVISPEEFSKDTGILKGDTLLIQVHLQYRHYFQQVRYKHFHLLYVSLLFDFTTKQAHNHCNNFFSKIGTQFSL